jgi:hypothetical protein
MAKKVTKPVKKPRALVAGVSAYSPPVSRLPAVANDIREMAKLLASKNGAFAKQGMTVLTDNAATQRAITTALRKTLIGPTADDSVFVYLAGHGALVGKEYYFIPVDIDTDDIASTGIPLTTIKQLFDQSKSRRVFLWLDFCHSGGIIARGSSNDGLSSIRRAIEVTQGEGKIIVAACTGAQSAYESSAIGHGLFTDALLRGLRGEAKSAHGEVTAASLYDFVDHQIKHPDQQPVFSGEMTGRIVLMHYPDRTAAPANVTRPATAKGSVATVNRRSDASWVMLGDNFFPAQRVVNQSNGSTVIELELNSGEDEAALASLRPTQYGGKTRLAFAVKNEAFECEVEDVQSEHVGRKQRWKIQLRQLADHSRFGMEMSFNGISPTEIARRRVGRILLNDPPVLASRSFGADSTLDGIITGNSGKYPAKGSAVQEAYLKFGSQPSWKEIARLKSVLLLKMTGTIEHVLDLKIGTPRNGKVCVKFRGRRPRAYSNVEPEVIELNGVCSL